MQGRYVRMSMYVSLSIRMYLYINTSNKQSIPYNKTQLESIFNRHHENNVISLRESTAQPISAQSGIMRARRK